MGVGQGRTSLEARTGRGCPLRLFQDICAQAVDTHIHQTLYELHCCPGREGELERESSSKVPYSWDPGVKMNWLQSQNSPSLQLPLSSPCSCLTRSHMEDHRFPAGRNELTQISFTNQVPAGWGSPCGFFFPCQQVQAPQFSRPQCHTCPFSLFGSTVD